jgi:predicted transcriptional regulator
MSSEPKPGAGQIAALKAAIVAALDVRAFYEQYLNGEKLKFKSDGWSEHVHCVIPPHLDQGKKNLSINVNSGGFKCFACGKAGSIFDFLCSMKGLDWKAGFQEALIELANKAGIQIEQWRKTPESTAAAPVDSTGKTDAPAYVPIVNKADAVDASRPPIAMSVVKKFQEALEPLHYKYLRFHRGYTDATIKKYMIGWDKKRKYKDKQGNWKEGKLVVPILCKEKKCRNLRVYAQDAPPDYKMINTKPYGSPPRLFPLPEIIENNPENLIYCEGEWDCMLLNQKLEEAGLYPSWMACTNTAGCNTFEPEWMEYFYGRNVIFLFDVDPAGKMWSASIATKHFVGPLSSGKIKSLKIVALPLEGTKDSNDVTDYFVKTGQKTEDLFRIIENTPQTVIGSLKNADGTISLGSLDATVESIDVDSFVTAIKDRKYIDQRIRVPLTIGGQSTKLYHATRSMRVVKCPNMAQDNCCASGAGLQIIPYGDPIFIESCMASRRVIDAALQNAACTMGKQCTVEEVEKVVMEEYFAHQLVKRWTVKESEDGRMVNSQELITVPVYILQPEKRIDIGPHDYMATGFIRSHPSTRQATMFIEHLEPLEEDWSKFEVNDETIPHLKAIQSYKNVKELLTEITTGVTQIYESDDILLTVLLTYLSPLRFNFNGSIMRGWINACILGDSGTGKSKTYMRISNWIELGDLFSALSGTRTGFLYSLKQKGTEWYVQTGRYVMANGKIIACDETQEMERPELKKMAISMDEGWLEVNQVASGGYSTQVRLLFIMNPPFGMKISDFPYGCQSLEKCFDPMFIRRLDIAVFTTGKEDYEFYNKEFDEKIAASIKLKPENLRTLIYWAWTRTANDITWTQEATKECLTQAIAMAHIYGAADDIPLVNPQDFRNNLARVSTALAILAGSFTEDYTGVVVKPGHVKVMAKFLDSLYSSRACNLRQHSKNSSKKKTLRDFDGVLETINKTIEHAKRQPDERWAKGQHFQQMLLLMQNQQYIRKRDLAEQLGVTVGWVQKSISILSMHSLVETHKGGYKITRKFNLFLQKWQEDPEVEKMLDQVQEQVGKLAMNNNDQMFFADEGRPYRGPNNQRYDRDDGFPDDPHSPSNG